jgi:iron-sulfur cluster insertion protein
LSAVKRIETILETEETPNQALRVTVSGGGCSGYQYGFSLDDTVAEDDRVFERNGIKVVVDDLSLDLLAGSEIDFVDDLIGSYFQVRNPNATASCGCGTSFAIG